MSSVSRQVNLSLSQAKELLKASAEADHARSNTFLHAACLQLELSIGFYWMELLEVDRSLRLKAGSVPPRLLGFKPNASPFNTLDSGEYAEFCRLWSSNDSWLARYLGFLTAICTDSTPFDRKQGLKGEIFVTVEDEAVDGQIKLTTVEEPDLSVKALVDVVECYEEMMDRHRSANEEY